MHDGLIPHPGHCTIRSSKQNQAEHNPSPPANPGTTPFLAAGEPPAAQQQQQPQNQQHLRQSSITHAAAAAGCHYYQSNKHFPYSNISCWCVCLKARH
jgi:hypothetical protein